MIQDVFLAYANNSLKENAGHLLTFFKLVKENIDIELEDAEEVVPVLVDLTSGKNNDLNFDSTYWKPGADDVYEDNHDWRVRLALGMVESGRTSYFRAKRASVGPWLSEIEYENRLRYERKMLESRECEFRATRCAGEGENSCFDLYKWKCYECSQLFFKTQIAAIAEGLEYSEISGFEEVLMLATEVSTRSTQYLILDSEQGQPARRILRQDSLSIRFGDFKYQLLPLTNTIDVFDVYVRCLASYSLAEWLASNDRRKLKLCPY